MDSRRSISQEEIIEISKKSMNHTFGELGLESLKSKSNKGNIGQFVESIVFGFENNSDANPDFIDAGIELKVTPIKRNLDNTFSSKERLVLNIIDYNDEATKTFEESSFYKKNKKLLIWFYEYIKGIEEKDFRVKDFELFEFKNSMYYKLIKRDWEIIHKKIVDGKAHEISESDTTFLSACTKGADANSLRKQPNSSILAKQRAYSFKNSFMTRLYRELLKTNPEYSSFISDDEWMNNSLEDLYKQKLIKYIGMSINELKNRFYIKSNSKSLTFMIAQKMLGLKGKETSTQEMIDAGIKLKTVRLNKNGILHESMSFPAFDFVELIEKKWEESDIRELFVDWKLMFFVFKDDENDVCRFKGVYFWNIPNKIVDGEIKEMYESAANLIKNGEALYIENGQIKDKFAKEKRNSNGVCHIRPHGINKKDVFELPVTDKETRLTEYTKQSFWFNKEFIKKLLEKIN